MADDQSGGANPSKKEREAGERAGRKGLGKDGRPQTPPTPTQQNAADHTEMTVRHSLKSNPQETEQATGKK
ncbi:hypothetical protein [Methylobacterium pseudosasicola]|uniref:Uncharacterized protein n=1 Tax=Methylobacterium pseudosasicola TaxID=582667 RepID=A0A1I4USJ1_9HYPH|nr:hypothetical protein [Methylobacterium pseudosasicola]SFM91875.1 hypothetical protein SAMN05192568_10764 [Methylobacterium pseudosasicola]